MRKYIKIEMESQISSLFSSILTTIKDYEDRTNKQIGKT